MPSLFSNNRRAPKFFEHGVDFITDEDLTVFTATAIATGAIAVSDVDAGGWASITGGAGGDGYNLCQDSTVFYPSAGKTMEYLTSIKSSTMANDKIIAGFALVDATLYASPPNEWVAFRVDADGNLDCSYRTGGAEVAVSTAVKALVANTVYDLKIECGINAGGTKFLANFFCNGETVAKLESTTLPTGRLVAALEALNSATTIGLKVDLVAGRQVR